MNPSVVIAAISFAVELLKFLRAKSENPKEAKVEMRRFRDAMRKARKEGDTSDIESKFKALGISKSTK